MKKALLIALAGVSTAWLGGCEKGETPAMVQAAAVVTSAPNDDIYMDYLNRPVSDDIFYFVLPDRFDNGDPSNDQGSTTHAESRGGFDPAAKGAFHGGDLAGLSSKLDYLLDMGVTAVWLTPVLRNQAVQGDSAGYHGYWILDFTEIDPHLGSNAELTALIDAAHSKGMKVFFDIIVNHTADVIAFRECHHDDGAFRNKSSVLCPYKAFNQVTSADQYSPFIPAGKDTIKTPAWLNDIQYYNNRGDSTWKGESIINGDFMGLDDLNTADPRVVNGMIDIYKNIISEFKPDGLRIDTVKHVEMSFWEAFSPAIMAHAKSLGLPQFHVFGEVAEGDAAFLSRYTTIGKLPATLDFQHFYSSVNVFAKNGSPQELTALVEDDDYYNDFDSSAKDKMSFISNHDNGRFGYFLNKHLPKASEQELTARSLLAHAYMYFSSGIPVIYYGDEQGFTGDAGDKDAREDMMPSRVDTYNDNNLLGSDATTAQDNFDTRHPIYSALADYAAVYKAHPALRRGAQFVRYAGDQAGIFAFSRIDAADRHEYLVVFNTSTQNQWHNFEATATRYEPIFGATEALEAKQGKVTVAIEGLRFAIYRAISPLAVENDLGIELVSAANDGRSPAFVDIRYQSAAQQHSVLPFLTVTTEVKLADNSYQLVAKDDNAPFGAKLLRRYLQDEKATLRVTVDNMAGGTTVKEFTIDVR